MLVTLTNDIFEIQNGQREYRHKIKEFKEEHEKKNKGRQEKMDIMKISIDKIKKQ